mgnify:CR=1 FL=1
MSKPIPTSIKTPAKLTTILGKYTPIKSTIIKTKVIDGQHLQCYQLDTAQLTDEQLTKLSEKVSVRQPTLTAELAKQAIKERGCFLPALKNVDVFGVADV